MTLRMLRRRGRRCELAESPPRLGASHRAPCPIDCLAGGRVRGLVAGFVLRGVAFRLGVRSHEQALTLKSPSERSRYHRACPVGRYAGTAAQVRPDVGWRGKEVVM